jgi:hypothetical protein
MVGGFASIGPGPDLQVVYSQSAMAPNAVAVVEISLSEF